jgi:integrase
MVPHVNVWVQEFRGRKYLSLQWHDAHTGERKTRTTGTADAAEAERQRADLEYELNHGMYAGAGHVAWPKFRELFEAEFVASRRKNTRRNYEVALDHFERLCRPTKLSSISERTLSAFVAKLRQERGHNGGLAASTVKLTVRLVESSLAWAVRQKFLTTAPKAPPVKVPQKNPQPVPAEAFERLLAVAPDDQTRAYLLCGWLAGLRLNEALALEWEPSDAAPYVDFAANKIVLPAATVKGDRDQWVPLAPELRAAIEALPRATAKVFNMRDRYGTPLSDRVVGNRIRRLARRAGVRLDMRSLRRGFISNHARRQPAQILLKLARHSNMRTTMQYYVAIDDAVMEAVLGDQAAIRSAGRSAAAETRENQGGFQP